MKTIISLSSDYTPIRTAVLEYADAIRVVSHAFGDEVENPFAKATWHLKHDELVVDDALKILKKAATRVKFNRLAVVSTAKVFSVTVTSNEVGNDVGFVVEGLLLNGRILSNSLTLLLG